MRAICLLWLMIAAGAAKACGAPVCVVDPNSLSLTRIITFDDTKSGNGPGHLISELLVLDGAVFGEHFAGQTVQPNGDHDQISGPALPPLTVLPGAPEQNLSVVYLRGNNVLNGYGVAGFPKRKGQGEGAISFLFDEDQSSLAFDIRGGESGTAHVIFLSRDGMTIAALDLPPVGEHAYGFIRSNGAKDIAGVVLTNVDPQGLALDNVRFGKPPDLS